MKKIVLASSSPRRRSLLEQCGYSFISVSPETDETINKNNDLEDEIKKLSLRKAEAALQRYPEEVIIGSDTIVTLNNKVLGKPHSEEEAFQMIKMLSGHTHEVITGLAVISKQRQYVDASKSFVTFAQLSDEEIREYIDTKEQMDKAGAYGIQGLGGRYVTHIEGDFYAIMGLPIHMVYEELKNYGY